jgi:hypothetical protein
LGLSIYLHYLSANASRFSLHPQPQKHLTIMDTQAALAAHRHDRRLDLFLGIANWFIFLDHMPRNSMSWITVRNFGFSGAADIFVFISGYAAAITFGRMILERGFIVGGTRVFKRAWQLYIAYVILFVIYVVAIGDVATRYGVSDIIYEFNVAGLVDHPIRTLAHGLFLQSKTLNLDVIELYIILMALFAPVLWLMLRKPDLTMAASVALYCAARQNGWGLPSFPDGNLYFNPFCWQLLFVMGAWFALGGTARLRPALNAPLLPALGIAYLVFALVMTMAGRFPDFGNLFPAWLFDAFNPNDKMNLAPYRVLHFLVLAFFASRLLPEDWPGLQAPALQPMIKCGQQSIQVFCVGVFLSFFGHFTLMTSSGTLPVQILIGVAGIAIMTLVAYYLAWSKQQDGPAESRLPAAAPEAETLRRTVSGPFGRCAIGPQPMGWARRWLRLQ